MQVIGLGPEGSGLNMSNGIDAWNEGVFWLLAEISLSELESLILAQNERWRQA